MTAPKLLDRGANGRFVALEKRLVQIYFRPFFFDGAFFGAAFVLGAVFAVVMPSDSERLSSTSTVCVMVSVPSGAGWAAAGAIVCVVGSDAVDPLLWRAQPAVRSAASVRTRMVFT